MEFSTDSTNLVVEFFRDIMSVPNFKTRNLLETFNDFLSVSCVSWIDSGVGSTSNNPSKK